MKNNYSLTLQQRLEIGKSECSIEQLANKYDVEKHVIINIRAVYKLIMTFYNKLIDKHPLNKQEKNWYKCWKNIYSKYKQFVDENDSLLQSLFKLVMLNKLTDTNIRHAILYANIDLFRKIAKENKHLRKYAMEKRSELEQFRQIFNLIDAMDEANLLVEYCLTHKKRSLANLYSLAIKYRDVDLIFAEMNITYNYFMQLIRKGTKIAFDFHRKRRIAEYTKQFALTFED